MALDAGAWREAFLPEARSPEAKLVWLLRGWLAALAVYSLAVEPRYTTRPLLFASAAWGLATGILFALLPTRRPRTLRAAEAATLASFSMHVMGHAFGWYHAFRWYDTALHFAIPIVTVLILYAFSMATTWMWDWRAITPLHAGILLFAMAVAIGTLWEVAEFGMDQIFGTREQDDLYDTMVDLVMDVLGALVGATLAALATRYGHRYGFDLISEPPQRPPPRRPPRATRTSGARARNDNGPPRHLSR